MNIQVLDTDSFDTLTCTGTSLVEFGADWCSSCKVMIKVMEQMQDKYPHHKFFRVDIDSSPELTTMFNIKAAPTFISFRDGKQLKTHRGTASEQQLLAMFE